MFGKTLWPGDRSDTRPLRTQDNTTQKHADKQPCLECDSNPRSLCPRDETHILDRAAAAIGGRIKVLERNMAMLSFSVSSSYEKGFNVICTL
jgi:hypothetical protein